MVHLKYKETLRDIFWVNHGNVRNKIFVDEKGNKIKNFDTSDLISYKEREQSAFSLNKWFLLKFSDNSEKLARVNEEFIVSSFYLNDVI